MLPKKKLTKAEAKALLEQAREHLSKGKLDEAERLASRVQVELANGWGLFEDSPHRVLRDIRRERTKRNRAEADALLAQARKDFEAGRIAEAKSKALRAERLHGPYSIWDFGDRPEKLLNEIQVAEARIRMRERIQQNQKKEDAIVDKPQESRPIEEPMVARAKNLLKLAREKVRAGDFATAEKLAEHVEKLGVNLAGSAETPQTIRRDIQLAKGSVPQPPAPGTTANAQPPEDANKLKARQLLAEARQHKDKLELLEARRKALEAQQLNVRYEPGELRPEQLLIDLAGLATKRIDVLVRRADDLVAMSAVEPARKQEAEQLLMEAKELGLGFSLDVQPVEMKLAWLRNQPTGQGTAVASSPKPAVSDTQQARGLDLLNKARMELRRGETSVARRLAEEAFRGPYGVQAQAEDLLRSIDAEEFNQQRNTANRFFDAFHSAYIRGDIMQAVTIGKSIDTKLLDSARLARFNEIMRTAEMQQALSAQNQPIRPASGATAVASDEPKSKGMTLADQVAALQKIQFQKLREEGLQAQREAIDRFRRGDTEEALRLLESYLEALNDADLDSSQIALLRRPIDARLDLFKKMKVQRELASMRQNERTTFEAMRSRQARAEELKKRTVKELMDDYNRLIDEGKYREAEMKALAALEMDPDNVAAAAGVKIARVQGNLVSYNKNKLAKEKYFVEVLNDAEKAPPVLTTDNPVSFPDDWADRIKRSKSWKDGITIGGLKSPKELEIERRLSEPISFNFKNVSLGEAIEDLNNLTGINVVPDYAALEEEGISLDQPLSLSLSSSISLKSALNLLLGQAKLTYIIKDEVLKITTPRRARGKLVQKTYQVADLVVPVDNYTIAETANLNSVLERVSRQNSMMNATGITPYTGPRSLPGGVPTGSPGEGEYSPGMEGPFPGQVHGQPQSSQAGRKPGQTLEDVLIKLITNTIDPHSWSQMGGPGTIDYFPLGMALVINQTPDIQEQVAELLAALRRLQDVEVAIEVRFISISESFYERIGVDFTLEIQPDTTKFEPQITSGVFKPPGFINDFSPSNFVAGITPAGTVPNRGAPAFTADLDIPIKPTSFGPAVPPFGGFPIAPGADGGISLGLAFLSDIQVFLFMEAAQGDVRTNIMQAPKLTMFNAQTATININDTNFFVTGNIIGLFNGQVVFNPQNTPFPLGVSLTLQPVVSADRRFVRVSLAPTLTNLTTPVAALFPFTTIVTPVFDTGVVGQPIPITQFIQQPSFTTVGVQTTVSVPDGGTVLLGGLKTLREGRNEFGPPILSKLPYLNRLVKNVGYGRDTASHLIMVTPRIIINEEEEIRRFGAPALQ